MSITHAIAYAGIVAASCTGAPQTEQGHGRLVDSRDSPESTRWDAYSLDGGGALLVELGPEGYETGRVAQATPERDTGLWVVAVQTPSNLVVAPFDAPGRIVGAPPVIQSPEELRLLAATLEATFRAGSVAPCVGCVAGAYGDGFGDGFAFGLELIFGSIPAVLDLVYGGDRGRNACEVYYHCVDDARFQERLCREGYYAPGAAPCQTTLQSRSETCRAAMTPEQQQAYPAWEQCLVRHGFLERSCRAVCDATAR